MQPTVFGTLSHDGQKSLLISPSSKWYGTTKSQKWCSLGNFPFIKLKKEPKCAANLFGDFKLRDGYPQTHQKRASQIKPVSNKEDAPVVVTKHIRDIMYNI